VVGYLSYAASSIRGQIDLRSAFAMLEDLLHRLRVFVGFGTKGKRIRFIKGNRPCARYSRDDLGFVGTVLPRCVS